MTADQVLLLKQSWEQILPKSAQMAGIFYYDLFEKHPHYHRMFKASLYAQQQKFVQMLDLIISHLDDPAGMLPELAASGQRHEHYGASAADYEAVGAVFLGALKTAMGEAWTLALQDAWASAYRMIAGYMINHLPAAH